MASIVPMGSPSIVAFAMTPARSSLGLPLRCSTISSKYVKKSRRVSTSA